MNTIKHLFLCGACLLFSGQAFAQEPATLAGDWKMVASPFDGGSEEIAFTATVSSDGKSLSCHADQFLVRGSRSYAADWTLAIEQNGDKVRLGWVLDADQPVSSEEYQEPASNYVIGGSNADGTHRYIYLLSENIETSRLEPMTLWSEWQSPESTTFVLPKTQQIYVVVSTGKPYSGSVGYPEIWASVKLQKMENTGIEVHTTAPHEKVVYNLQGVRQNQMRRGLNIVNGRKIMVY